MESRVCPPFAVIRRIESVRTGWFGRPKEDPRLWCVMGPMHFTEPRFHTVIEARRHADYMNATYGQAAVDAGDAMWPEHWPDKASF